MKTYNPKPTLPQFLAKTDPKLRISPIAAQFSAHPRAALNNYFIVFQEISAELKPKNYFGLRVMF